GEVFIVPEGNGVTRNLSRTPGSNDRGAVWSPDGKWIAWIGDGSGETEIYLYDVEKGGDAQMITKNNDTYIRSLQFSPDSKKIYYGDRKNRFVEVDVASHAKKTVLQNPEAEYSRVVISPDSKWLTYTRPAQNEMSVVYLYDLAAGKEYPVTERWYNSGSPIFSTDGKYLIFTSDRDFSPTYSSVEWDYAYNNLSAVYMTMLTKDTPSPLIESDGVVAPAKEEKSEGPVTIKVDPDGLSQRIIKLPVTGRVLYSDGKKVWFTASGKTRTFDFATRKSDDAADGTVSYRAGDKKAYVSRNGALMTAPFGAKMNFSETANLGNMVATVDFSEEWPQIFDEVWRAFRDGYYVQNMHGRDWKAVKEKYAPLVPYAKTRMDLNYIIGEMISELASGHAYVTIGEYPKPTRIQMGLLGAELSKVSGGFRIDHILPGAPYSETLRSPLTEPGLGVKEGDVISAIDGLPLKDVDNIYKLMVGKAGVLTELTFTDGKKVVVKPIADEYPLYHYQWVQNNIKTVEEKSGGKVGYIYIPDMSAEGLNEFARYYYPQLDKEALIIDDRANGGGNVSPMIIERLQREVYRMTMRRGSTLNGTIPEGTHTGPKVLLIDKYSASDGDLFPWSFRATGLGTIIGTRTWGGIVGISGSLPYMDGTDVRVPFFTNYDAKTGEWIVENHGVDPDILIDNDPIQEAAGIDQQLLKAIEVAMEQIKTRKPLPDRPKDRTFKDLGLEQMP
ncbi:MAG: PDZ domain-containing protein, partial [Bacteroidales bacterium]|nr:PDZ domain-containing protein [Bacteroidales bacterium]